MKAGSSRRCSHTRLFHTLSINRLVSALCGLTGRRLTGSAAAGVDREGRFATVLLRVAALGPSGLEIEHATAHKSGEEGERNEEEDRRLHRGNGVGYLLALFLAPSALLFIHTSGDAKLW
jgi:hypothetical protein